MPPSLRPLVAAAVLGVASWLAAGLPAAAQEASVRLEGAQLVVEARDASLNELLQALAEETGLVLEGVDGARIEGTVLDGSVSGSRRGSLEQVLGWLLRGHSYALVYSPSTARAERLVIGIAPASGERGTSPPARARGLDEEEDWDEESWEEEPDWEEEEEIEEWWRSSLGPGSDDAGRGPWRRKA